jgi:hypothetical protein
MLKKLYFLSIIIFSAGLIQAQPISCSIPMPGEFCETACVSCMFSNVTGNNGGIISDGRQSSCIQVLHNSLWYSFIAGISGSAHFTITPSNCQNGDGLQIALYSDCSSLSLFCDAGSVGNGDTPLGFQAALIQGQTYFLVIDGFNGDVCDYSFSGTPAIAFQAIPPGPTGSISGPAQVCPNATVSYTITPVQGAQFYTWTVPPDATINGLPGPGPHTFDLADGTTAEITFGNSSGNISVRASNACLTGNTSTKLINVGPIPLTVLPDTLVCRSSGPVIGTSGDTLVIPATIRQTLITPGGCDSVVEVTIKYKEFAVEPPPILLTTATTPISCFGEKDGAIMLSATGGDSSFTYIWSNKTTSQNLSNIPAGLYTVTVRDGNGCTKTTAVDIFTPPIEIDADVTHISCAGAQDGSVLITVANGKKPYTYTISNGANGTITGDTLLLSGLSGGPYNMTVANADGCIQTDTFVLVEPQPLIGKAIYCEYLAAIQASGGTLPYYYKWPTGDSTAQAYLQPGHYDVSVIDSKGCSIVVPVLIKPVPDPCTLIEGIVRLDDNGDCNPTFPEQPLAGWFIRAIKSTGEVYLSITGQDGRYFLRAGEGGFYRVEAISPDSNLVSCISGGVDVTIGQNSSTTVFFAAQKTRLCPKMTVDITSPRLRRCFSDNYYQIRCANEGTQTATNVYVEVYLDTFLTFLSSTLPADTLDNNVYRFFIGNMDPNDVKNFQVQVKVNCSAALGQTHCTKAHIYPDTTCTPRNPLWKGGKVSLSARCNSDSLRFSVKNTGNATLTTNLKYTLIENVNLGKTGVLNLLAPGDSALVAVPANGSTWRLEVEQEPYSPGAKRPALSVEGCRMSGPFNTGFVTRFPVTTDGPWEDIDCNINIGAYDPNDKQGKPEGVGIRHYIEPQTDLEYLIRFQNTGTDTAFNVIIRDTLSSWLDPFSIRPGASSHPYQFELTGRGVLLFTFPNIMLPDSNINERASNGFVSYTVGQRAGVLLESDIFNRAAIYFDFNAPIFTNTTAHRVGRDFIVVNVWEPTQPQYAVRVQPQPMSETAQIIVENAPIAGDYVLQIFDLNGRLFKQITGKSPAFEVQRNNMPEGVYLFKVLLDGVLAGNGKLIVQH